MRRTKPKRSSTALRLRRMLVQALCYKVWLSGEYRIDKLSLQALLDELNHKDCIAHNWEMQFGSAEDQVILVNNYRIRKKAFGDLEAIWKMLADTAGYPSDLSRILIPMNLNELNYPRYWKKVVNDDKHIREVTKTDIDPFNFVTSGQWRRYS